MIGRHTTTLSDYQTYTPSNKIHWVEILEICCLNIHHLITLTCNNVCLTSHLQFLKSHIGLLYKLCLLTYKETTLISLIGWNNRARTCDQNIKLLTLYQLSYIPIYKASIIYFLTKSGRHSTFTVGYFTRNYSNKVPNPVSIV